MKYFFSHFFNKIFVFWYMIKGNHVKKVMQRCFKLYIYIIYNYLINKI